MKRVLVGTGRKEGKIRDFFTNDLLTANGWPDFPCIFYPKANHAK